MKYNEKWPWGTTRFYPHEMTNMMQVVIVCLAVLMFFTVFYPGFFIPREEPADPLNTPEHIKPEWYFMGSYQALKEFKTITISETLQIPGEIQGIAFQVFVIMAMFAVPFWERGKRKPGEPVKANKIALAASGLIIIFLIMGLISNIRQEFAMAEQFILQNPDLPPPENVGLKAFSGIILHLIAIAGFATMPFWGGFATRRTRLKKPLFYGTLIAIVGFVYLTIKGLMI
ncbi:hypothetical protein ACFL7D_08845 [candidate division KSB1 bacterium]